VYEEAPASYKDIDRVVDCLTKITVVDEEDGEGDNEREGLVRILATLQPMLTYKYKDPNFGSQHTVNRCTADSGPSIRLCKSSS